MPAPADPSDDQAASWPAAPIQVLDTCHREILKTLQDLRGLVLHVQAVGADEAAQETARHIHLFLSTVAVRHHQDEERHVFPVLLKHGDALLSQQVLDLQAQHGRLEEEWIALAPLLDGAARGYAWRNSGEVAARVDAYTDLYREHIALEETQVLPRARQLLGPEDLHRMSRDMTRRRLHPPPSASGRRRRRLR